MASYSTLVFLFNRRGDRFFVLFCGFPFLFCLVLLIIITSFFWLYIQLQYLFLTRDEVVFLYCFYFFLGHRRQLKGNKKEVQKRPTNCCSHKAKSKECPKELNFFIEMPKVKGTETHTLTKTQTRKRNNINHLHKSD